MEDGQIWPFCRKHGIKLSANWRNCLNVVRYHSSKETRKHFFYKCEVAWALLRKGQTVFTELQFDYSRPFGRSERMRFPVADLVWLDEKIIVEFESRMTAESKSLKEMQFKGFNTFVFDLRKTSVDEILERIGAK